MSMETQIIDFGKVTVKAVGDYIVIDGKAMLVKDDSEWSYKLMKRHIKHGKLYSATDPDSGERVRFNSAAESLAFTVRRWMKEADTQIINVGKLGFIDHYAYWALKVIAHVKEFGKPEASLKDGMAA